MAEWIDITLPLGKEIPVLAIGDPDNPAVPIPKVERFFDVEKGDVATMSRIEMISHDGTHIDAPLHFIRGGKTIDEMPIDTTIGPARVIEIKDEKDITVRELEQHDIKSGERILFKTRNSPGVYSVQWYDGPHVTLSLEGAKYLAEKKVRLVGVGVSNLEPSGRGGQLPLFDRRDAREEEWEKAERAMDEIMERFGHDAVKRGSLLEKKPKK